MKIAVLLLSLSLGAMAITKEEISNALDSMIASGQFSKEQIEAAKKELNSMSQSQINEIERKAHALKDDPNIRRKAESLQLDMKKQGK